MHDRNGADVYRTGSGFRYPLQKDRTGRYKIQSGALIRVCMSSDFFLEQADEWRDEAWEIMRKRSDVKFFLLTKHPQRVKDCLPKDWGDGWENIFFNVTCENQRRADERIPIMLDLPFKHKGIMCATHDVTFCFVETGTNFIKDGKQYRMPKKQLQSEMVFKSGVNYAGKPMVYKLTDQFGQEIPKEKLYVSHYRKNCETCGNRPICNGCSDCGRCKS